MGQIFCPPMKENNNSRDGGGLKSSFLAENDSLDQKTQASSNDEKTSVANMHRLSLEEETETSRYLARIIRMAEVKMIPIRYGRQEWEIFPASEHMTTGSSITQRDLKQYCQKNGPLVGEYKSERSLNLLEDSLVEEEEDFFQKLCQPGPTIPEALQESIYKAAESRKNKFERNTIKNDTPDTNVHPNSLLLDLCAKSLLDELVPTKDHFTNDMDMLVESFS